MQEVLTDQAPFETLAIYGDNFRDVAAVKAAANYVGLTVLDLPADPSAIDLAPAAGIAWRCPPGLAVEMRQRGTPLPVTGASAHWFAALPQI